MNTRLVMGVDIGSTASKCVLLREGKMLSSSVIAVGAGTSGPARAIGEALEKGGVRPDALCCTFATGYGRNSLKQANKQLSELSCHARGAYAFFPEVRTVIDIGGQDAKALRIGSGGRMLNFVMNDKCAAGTGRFLDVMARVLEVRVDQLAEYGAQSTKNVEISSTCTVFAESEVISQLSRGTDVRDIIEGIHRSVAVRAAGLARRIGVEPMVVMTGGVAQNAGIVRCLEEALHVSVVTTPMAQFAGALGAALYAWDSVLADSVPEISEKA